MFTGIFQKIIAFFMGIAAFFSNLLGLAQKPSGSKLDLTGYRLVFEDEFDGDALDTDAWFYRKEGLRYDNFNAASQVGVSDGQLTITAQYREDGEFGPGWYSGMLALN